VNDVELQKEIKKCPECGEDHIIKNSETAEVICTDCGVVLSMRIIDRGPEWRAFNNEQREKRKRVGSPVSFTLHDKGLSTTIGRINSKFYSKNTTSIKRAQLFRMRKWQRRARISDSRERNLAFALSSISKICSQMKLPPTVLETASLIYRGTLKKQMSRGRSIQRVVAASIYLACRKCRVVRTLNEVANISGIDRTDVGRCYRLLVKKLNEVIPPSGPEYYVSRFANQLGLAGNAELIAIRILQVAQKLHLTSGKAPFGIGAAATYIASIIINDRKTQREFAEVANVTEVTIRNRYKDLVKNMNIVIKL
jgi:transcription initiation factor TFIIB